MTSLLITKASCVAALAAYTASAPLLQAIFTLTDMDRDQWNREHARWQRLRETSPWFRSNEAWLIGLARLVAKRLPWFVELPVRNDPSGRVLTQAFATVFGRPKPLEEAVRICTNLQPWTVAEQIASAGIIGLGTTLLVALATQGSLTFGWWLVVTGLCGWMAYRGTILRFILQAEVRRRAIRRFLPHAMDSIAMVISSGDPFVSGIDSVIRDFPDHPLSQEFVRLRNSLERGQTKDDALSASAYAVCLPEFEELVRVLGRIHKHGVPAADNFTRLARQLRVNQLRYMEEDIGRAEAAMSLPTMFVMFACIVVACAPFLLSFMQSGFM